MMKLMKKTNIYKSSTGNVTFNPETKEAFSYKWWKFVSVINGFVVFNSYRYSVTTSKHQRDVRTLLNTLNIKIDLEIKSESGLQSDTSPIEALENAYRQQDFNLISKIKEVFKIEFTENQIEELYLKMEEEKCDIYLNNAFKRDEKIFQKGLINLSIDKIMKEKGFISLDGPKREKSIQNG